MPASDESPSEASGPSTPNTPRTLATRNRDGRHDASGSKRKRADAATGGGPSNRRRTIEPNNDDDSDDSDAYDPDQPVEERRDIQRTLRELGRELADNADEYLKGDSSGIRDLLLSANEINPRIKQTGEAVIDSRFLVSAADLSYKRTVQITHGNVADGVDVDEFLSKCKTYMRQGGSAHGDNAPELSSTQRRRRNTRGHEGSDEEDEDGDMMNWGYFGHYACLPNIGRPSIQGHLLGPLSVEKKARKLTKRSAPFRMNQLTETRPEVINAEDLTKHDNDLAVICGKVLQQLTQLQSRLQGELEEILPDIPDEDQTRIMHQHGVRDTGGIDLMRFVINPKSFGQTIENIFYVSFLIKDGKVSVDLDSDGIPALCTCSFLHCFVRLKLTLHSLAPVDDDASQSARRSMKWQGVFTLDMDTWRDIIETLDIKEPMIPHRREASHGGPGARGWYS